MKLIRLSHANVRTALNQPVPVYIAAAHIAGLYWSESTGCTNIISVGAIIPVSEKLDDVIRLIQAQPPEQTKEANDGNEKSQ